jgi:undecaprenyl-diphosphatase
VAPLLCLSLGCMATSLPEAILLGLLQGLTEFLPVSSSGHLVLAQELLRAPQPGITLEITLHAGTLLAVLFAYRRDVATLVRDGVGALRGVAHDGWSALRQAREIGWLLLASIPAGLAGILLDRPIEAAFERPPAAAAFLLVTGVMLLATRWLRRGTRPVGSRSALAMGMAQAISLLPGISRSGATITGGLAVGAQAGRVVRFSFLMSIPAILGSLLVNLPELTALRGSAELGAHGAGFLVAFLSGLVAIRLLVTVVARGRLHLFGVYCLVAGLLAGWWLW